MTLRDGIDRQSWRCTGPTVHAKLLTAKRWRLYGAAGRVQVEEGRSGRERAHGYRRSGVGIGSCRLVVPLLLLAAPLVGTTGVAAASVQSAALQRPTVTSIGPESGPAKGGTTVVIHGTELGHASSVKFGTKAAKVIRDTDSSITATSPSQPVGTVNVSVTTAKGTSAVATADRYTYAPCTGPITKDTTIDAGGYIISCTMNVPAGVTLTVGPGAVFKGSAKGQINVEGSLRAVGTGSSPIIFTSVNDNSVGGKTGNGKPTAGGWGDIFVSGKGSIDLQHATVRYAKYGVLTNGSGPVVVTDDTLASISNEGLYVVGNPSPVVEGNTATDVGSRPHGTPAYFVSTNHLNPTTLGSNRSSGGWDLFEIGGAVGTKGVLPVAPTPWYLAGALAVPSGITLTLAPGIVFKGSGFGSLSIGGTLDAVGTSPDPITFTSVNDSSVGGTTGSGDPAAGDWGDLAVSGTGSIDLQHATIEYAKYGVLAGGTGSVVMKGDSFTSISSEGIYVVGNPSPVIEGNAATDVGSRSGATPAYFVSTNHLNPTTLGSNRSSGGWDLFEIGGAVGTKGVLPVAPTPWYLAGALAVPSGITLTLAPGIVFKGSGFGSLSIGGTLDAVGTSPDPITFTSVNDSSVGGTTGSGDPAAGDWGDLAVNGAGSIDLQHATIRYAGYGVLASGTGSVRVTGDTFTSISNEGVYVIDDPSPVIEDNAATDVGSRSGASPAYFVSTDGLNPATLGGNTATGGWNLFEISGAVGATGTLPAAPTPWYLEYQLDIPSGHTLTVAAGAVLKGSAEGQVSVQGSLDAAGTATHRITFTSVNDSSVGGTTGTGAPAAGDWLGIVASGSGSIQLVDCTVTYAVQGDT